MVKVPKSSGIIHNRQTEQESEDRLFDGYQDYFRGKHYQAFSKDEDIRERLGLDEHAVRNELDPQPINLPIDRIKIFEVKGHTIDLSALPTGTKAPEETTYTQEIRPQEIESHFKDFKHKILAAVSPKEVAKLKQLEARMA